MGAIERIGVERLISIVDCPAVDAVDRLAGLDAESVAGLLLAEIADRAALLPAPATAVTVQVELELAGRDVCYRLMTGPDGVVVEAGIDAAAPVRLRQNLAELAQAVYGPRAGVSDATRELVVVDEPAVGRAAAVVATYQIAAACAPSEPDLDALAVRFGTDKWGGHWYTPHYQRHLGPYRRERVRLLEIGVGGYNAPDAGGESLRMWKHYFPRGLVYGLDIYDKSHLAQPRLQTIQGDQSDSQFLATLADRVGPLDIVIDDGSHRSIDVITSFQALFPRLRHGGMYVIEDLQTAYWLGWNGGRGEVGDPGTSVGFLKGLVDGLHHQERDPAPTPAATDTTVGAVHFYHNIAFVEKRRNTEQPASTSVAKAGSSAAWTAASAWWAAKG